MSTHLRGSHQRLTQTYQKNLFVHRFIFSVSLVHPEFDVERRCMIATSRLEQDFGIRVLLYFRNGSQYKVVSKIYSTHLLSVVERLTQPHDRRCKADRRNNTDAAAAAAVVLLLVLPHHPRRGIQFRVPSLQRQSRH